MWKLLEKRPFFRADMAGLGKYCTGGYGRIGVYRVKENFQALLSNDCWEDVLLEENPNEIWSSILEKINTILETMCPIKRIKVTKNRPFWLSHHILESIHDRNNLYAKAKKSNNYNDLVRARYARNNTNRLINSAKEEFIKESLESNISDPKKFWKIINNTIIKNNAGYDNVNLKNDEGTRLSLEDSCIYMNDYLVSIGDKLTGVQQLWCLST